jgi:hypothetical protein
MVMAWLNEMAASASHGYSADGVAAAAEETGWRGVASVQSGNRRMSA